MRKAIFAGSFNPIHEGHIDILKKAAGLFDLIYVVVAQNPDKEKVSFEVRKANVLAQLQKEKINTKYEVVHLNDGDLIAHLAKDLGVDYLIRSARDGQDYEYEIGMANMNTKYNKDLETIVIVPQNDKIKFRSSLIRK